MHPQQSAPGTKRKEEKEGEAAITEGGAGDAEGVEGADEGHRGIRGRTTTPGAPWDRVRRSGDLEGGTSERSLKRRNAPSVTGKIRHIGEGRRRGVKERSKK